MKYTGFRDRPLEERQLRFQTECREGHADIVSYYFNSLCMAPVCNVIVLMNEELKIETVFKRSGFISIGPKFILKVTCLGNFKFSILCVAFVI